MTVYVDDMAAPFGRMKMFHMVADTQAELLEMADLIGVARRWIQSEGRHGEHFDVCASKRALAVKAGAVEVSTREIAEMCFKRRGPDGKARYLGGS